MKLLLISLCLMTALSCAAQNETNPNYDADLAKRLGGDEYGMKSYVFVILKSGDNTSTDKNEVSAAFRGHQDNISRLAEEGKLHVAGPFGANDDDFRGLFIMDISMEEVKEVLNTDPAISQGFISYIAYPWYGSAAIGEYLDEHEKIWLKNH